MTSKEALDKLPQLMLAKNITILNEISNLFNIIYKDLEILETIKELIGLDYVEDNGIEHYTMTVDPKEAQKAIREWLNDE